MTPYKAVVRNSHENRSGTKKTIALFGEVLADVFPDKSVLGGAPYNVARHLQALGQHPLLITRTGNDPLRDTLLAEMSHLHMDDSGVQSDPSHPTGQVIVHINRDGHQFEILPDQAYDHIHSGITHLVTMTSRPDMVYFGTLAQRTLESRLALDTFLSDAKSPRFLDMNLRRPWYDKHTIRRSLLRSDIVKISAEELAIVADLFHFPAASLRNHSRRLMQQFALSCLLVTCGAEGAWMLAKDGTEASVPGCKLNTLVDTVGAGDGFAAVSMLGLLLDWPADIMLSRANAFAAALCGIRGAAPEHSDFYQPFIEKWQV